MSGSEAPPADARRPAQASQGGKGARFRSPASQPVEALPAPHFKGMDAALSKMMPTDFSGRRVDYKEFRTKALLFEKLCRRRGEDCAVEGTLMFASALQGQAFQAVQELSTEDMEAEDGLEKIRKVLDKFYQYDETVEGPQRCEEYFERFHRKAGETLNEYELREREHRKKLKEIGIEIPEYLAGWVCLSRAGIPKFQEPLVKSMLHG